VCERLLEEGVLSKDTHDTVVRIAPPLVVTEAQIDEAVDALASALRSLEQSPARTEAQVPDRSLVAAK
jgi:ornithine--oxo-acid transaminase